MIIIFHLVVMNGKKYGFLIFIKNSLLLSEKYLNKFPFHSLSPADTPTPKTNDFHRDDCGRTSSFLLIAVELHSITFVTLWQQKLIFGLTEISLRFYYKWWTINNTKTPFKGWESIRSVLFSFFVRITFF